MGAANLAYCILLGWMAVECGLVLSHPDFHGWPQGIRPLLAQLGCAVIVAVVFGGDPRYRSLYDVFGLTLFGALIVGHFDRLALACRRHFQAARSRLSTQAPGRPFS